MPGGGQLNVSAGACQQRCAQILFQLFDGVAERWLGYMQTLCGPAEAEFFGHGSEIAQQACVYIHSVSRLIGCDVVFIYTGKI